MKNIEICFREMRNLKILKDTHSGEEGYPQVMSFTRAAL